MSTLASPARPETTPDSPYVGLTSYTQDDAQIFFGRDAERKVLIANLRASRLTLLYARSGTGKSSLLRAGVAARLQELTHKHRAERGTIRNVPVIISSWHDEPTDELIDAVQSAISELLPEAGPITLPRTRLVDALAAAAAIAQATLLIILDQFEEYLLATPNEARDGRFADELAACLNRPDLPANFLIAVREDAYFGLGDLFKRRVENVYGNYLHLRDLDRAAARDAITGPIARVNDLHPEWPPIEMDPTLVSVVLDQLSRPDEVALDPSDTAIVAPSDGDERNGQIAAPYLQLVMRRLWDAELEQRTSLREPPRLRLQTLAELGGAGTIVTTHVDRALGDLSGDDRDAAVDIFRHLVTRSGTKIALAAPDLADYTDQSDEEVQELLEHLTQADVRILHDVPPSPGTQEPRFEISHDLLAPPILEWCTKVMHERSEAELAADLRRRHRRLVRTAAALSALVVLLIAGLLMTLYFQRQSDQAASIRDATEATTAIQSNPSAALATALHALNEWHTRPAEDALRAVMPTYLRLERVMVSRYPQSLARFVPGGGMFTYGYQTIPSVAAGATLRDARGRVTKRFSDLAAPVPGGVAASHCCAVVSDRGHLIATVRTDGSATLFDVGENSPISLGSGVTGVAISPTEDAAVVLHKAHATVIDARSGARIGTIPVKAIDAGITGDGTVITVSADGFVKAWRNPFTTPASTYLILGAAKVVPGPDADAVVIPGTGPAFRVTAGDPHPHKLAGNTAPLDTAAFDRKGYHILTAGEDGILRIYDTRSSALTVTMATGGGAVKDAAFSHSGALVATATNDGRVRLWNALGGWGSLQLGGAAGALRSISFSADDTYLIAAGDDHMTRVWTVAPPFSTAVPPATVKPNRRNVPQTVLDADVTGANGGLVGFASAQVDTFLQRPGESPERLHVGPSNGVAFSPNGRHVVTITRPLDSQTPASAHIRLVSKPRDPGPDVYFPDKTTILHHPSFSPDGGSVVFASPQGQTIVWPWRSQEPLTSIPTGPASSAAYSPDGSRVAVGGKGSVTLWNPQTDKPEARGFQLDAANVVALAYDGDGSHIAAGSEAGDVAVWNRQTRQRLARLTVPAVVTDVRFGTQGQWLVVAATDGSVRVWDWKDNVVLATLQLHAGATRTAEFMPGHPRMILSTGDDGITSVTPCTTCASIDTLVTIAHAHQGQLRRSSH